MFEILLLSAVLAAEPDAAALLQSADAPRQGFLHSIVKVRATMQQTDKPSQTGDFDLYLGNDDEQLVVFRDKKNKGRKFLMRGDKAWLIVPGSQHPIAVTANQRMLGTMSYTDIARVRLAQDYSGVLLPGMQPCGEPAQLCRVVEITANTRSAPYASGTLWIDGDGLLRKAVYALASGKPAKKITYRYVDKDGRMQPARMTVIDLLLPDKSDETTLEYLDHRPAEHPAARFDPEQQIQR
ncbi:MAG: outer membrane lipoprotein-sorting protein [Pseudomonadota bacterium]|mgnify:FL=1